MKKDGKKNTMLFAKVLATVTEMKFSRESYCFQFSFVLMAAAGWSCSHNTFMPFEMNKKKNAQIHTKLNNVHFGF